MRSARLESNGQRKKEALAMTLGAVTCGIVAGVLTTTIFLWIYRLDTYRVAFSGRFLRELSPHFKYLLLVLTSSAWFLIFSKWIFKRNDGTR
jgi:hypothetical protein